MAEATPTSDPDEVLHRRVEDLDFELGHRGLAPAVRAVNDEVVVVLSVEDAGRLVDAVRSGAGRRDPLASTWTPIDSTRVLSEEDLELLGRARAAHAALGRHLVELPSVLHVMRDAEAGHPKAASSDGGGDGPAPWCWSHQRPVTICNDRLGLGCAGEVIDGHGDPTGEAATGDDRVGAAATSHLATMRRKLDELARAVADVDAIAAGYPVHAKVDDSKVAAPGPGICRLCWADGQLIRPIEADARGRRKYKDLCRRDGDWRKKLGGVDPPPWFISRLNRGEPITPEHLARAQQWATSRKAKKRGKAKAAMRTTGWKAAPAEPVDQAPAVDRAARAEQLREQRRERLRRDLP